MKTVCGFEPAFVKLPEYTKGNFFEGKIQKVIYLANMYRENKIVYE